MHKVTKMNKVVINRKFGGFGLSKEACVWMKEHGVDINYRGYKYSDGRFEPIDRHDPILVQCVEELGDSASCSFSRLVVVEIPGNMYRIVFRNGTEEIIYPDEQNWIVI